MGDEAFMTGSDGVIVRVEDVGFVVGGMGMAMVLLLWGIGIGVDVEDGLGIDVIVNVGDGTGGVLGEGNPMTRE